LRRAPGITFRRSRHRPQPPPTLPTDQTATLLPTESADAVAAMLPVVHHVQGTV